MHFKSLHAAQAIFKALSAPTRIQIMELLLEGGNKNLNDLAKALHLTNSAISLHTKVLKDAGLIEIETTSGIRGTMKLCRPTSDMIVIDMITKSSENLVYEDDIAIGYYINCKVKPTCGLATCNEIIGEFDNPKYFLYPKHFESSVLWLSEGFIEYNLPNHLLAGQSLTSLSLSFEISSECPGYNEDYPSDIYFYLNDTLLGYWISPGDFGARRGRFTPEWWPKQCNQYGLLKTLSVTKEGTFIDGIQLSDITISKLNITYTSTLTFRFEVSKESKNCGGFTIFGRHFGDYDQGILFQMSYTQ